MEFREVVKFVFLAAGAASVCAMIFWTVSSAMRSTYATCISLRMRDDRVPIGRWNVFLLVLAFLGWAGALALGLDQVLRIIPGSWRDAEGLSVRFSIANLIGACLAGMVIVGTVRYPALYANGAPAVDLYRRLGLTCGAVAAVEVLERETQTRIQELENRLPEAVRSFPGNQQRWQFAEGVEIEALNVFLRTCEQVKLEARRQSPTTSIYS